MDFLRNPWTPNPSSALQAPPPRRISTTAGERLSAIVSDRPSTSQSLSSPSPQPNRWSSTTGGKTLPRLSHESRPPAYALSVEPLPEDEKPATRDFMLVKRGGWKRLAALVLIACVAIGLGVGLGLGLTRRRHVHPAAPTVMAEGNATTEMAFPVGEYSLVTALRTVQTNCTSSVSTWRCYPYATYASSPSASMTSFNWILANTSAVYATNTSSLSTDSRGVAANLSLSSSDNPFSIVFDSTPLTYINDTSPRYTFSVNISQKVIPSSSITSDNRATACFFNQTQLVGTLHLSNSVTEDVAAGNSTSYTPWPYPIRVELVSSGGTDTPACYYTTDGVVGERVTDVLTAQSSADECICDYRNYS